MKRNYKYIVIGCGGIGSAALYWLSRQNGGETLGLEQFELGHPRGESDDHSRIIRLSYHSPVYTALTPKAYAAWKTVEEESGTQLVFKTGGLDFGTPKFLADFADAMDSASIPYEWLTNKEVSNRWPQFENLPEWISCLYQADAGLVAARKATSTHIDLARRRGATIMDNTPVKNIRFNGDKVHVETSNGEFIADRLIVASGPWTNQVLSSVDISLPLTVTQEQVTYYKTPYLSEFELGQFPIWLWQTRGGVFYYGIPAYGEKATKASRHLSGKPITADTRTFEPNEYVIRRLSQMIEKHIPHFVGPVLYTKTCLYTLTPDGDFIIDTVPGHPNAVVIVGSGHAFKFASLLGKISSELAVDGKTSYPIQSFSVRRRSLKKPVSPAQPR
ncbi:N-methyl-L-tryptophan oxidase [Candidatus Parcubacteria bacterium]|nr:N-methyl-L-tryptophan oxidase [Candidatus Parcubacteria bacterium]